VGAYDARWPRLEAEWFMAAEAVVAREAAPCGAPPCNFVALFGAPGARATFPNVANVPARGALTLLVAAARVATTVRVWGGDGAPLASCSVPAAAQPAEVACSPLAWAGGAATAVVLEASEAGLALDALRFSQ
jgi:hypothetical protein